MNPIVFYTKMYSFVQHSSSKRRRDALPNARRLAASVAPAGPVATRRRPGSRGCCCAAGRNLPKSHMEAVDICFSELGMETHLSANLSLSFEYVGFLFSSTA